MSEIHFTYLNGPDIERLSLDDREILDAIEAGLRAQGLGQAVIEPRVHLEPDPAFNGHFNVLRGYLAPQRLAGVKIVGDYVENWRRGLPSEMALVVDDWGQCRAGRFGALRVHVEAGKLSEATLHAELCQIVAGARPGRERPDETILFWHRGLSLSDIALGHALLEKARRLGVGQRLRYA